MRRQNMSKTKLYRYSIRKTSVGVGSVAVGLFMLLSNQAVYANELVETAVEKNIDLQELRTDNATDAPVADKTEVVRTENSSVNETEVSSTNKNEEATTVLVETNEKDETTASKIDDKQENNTADKMHTSALNRQAEDAVTEQSEDWRKVNHYDKTNQSIQFDEHWKFNLGEVVGATSQNYDDSSWKDVNLPHDFSIHQDTTENGEAESGYKLGGEGWYRKTFSVSQEVKDGRVQLHFDGAYMETEVFINGQSLGVHPNGYTSFSFDLTDHLKVNEENQLAVKVVNKIPSSRWYSGSGIYRSVHLNLLPAVHFEEYGIKVKTPDLETTHDKASGTTVQIEAKVTNQSNESANIRAKSILFERNQDGSVGTKVAESTLSPNVSLQASQQSTIQHDLQLVQPKLWSLNNPNLYILRTELYKDGEKIQTTDQETGFRYISFDSNTGFKLNGQSLKLQGVSMHHDQGSLGAAAYYDAVERQFDILKDMGVNAVRVTHNPASRVMKDIANRKGMLLIDEAFDTWEHAKNGNVNDYAKWFNQEIGNNVSGLVNADASQTWAEYHIKQMVRSGLNDPSIIMWSTGNEVMEGITSHTPGYPHVIANLIRWVDEVDGTRPTTLGDNKIKDKNTTAVGMANVLSNKTGIQGLIGYNYANGQQYDAGHADHPNWIIYGSETASSVNSRGVYNVKGNERRQDKQLTSYDQSKVGWGHYASEAWYDVITRDFVSGEFVWTGFDYLGEPTPWNGVGTGSVVTWPAPKSSYFGIVDTAGFPKDSYYFYRSQWKKDDTTLHVLPAWNESVVKKYAQNNVEVVVYSNAAKVKLVHVDPAGNETELGTKSFTKVTTPQGHTYQIYQGQDKQAAEHKNLYLTWQVPYRAGEIKAIAYDELDQIIDQTVGNKNVKTFGQATQLEATVTKPVTTAHNQSLAYVAIDVKDAQGNLVIDSNKVVSVEVSGPAELVAMDNGDATDHQAYNENNRKAFGGKVLAILKMTGESGTVSLKATAPDLAESQVNFDVVGTPKDDKEIDSYLLPKVVYVRKGDTITLPETLTVRDTALSESEKGVTFDQNDAQAKVNEGTSFVAKGTINGTDIPVSTYVSVIDQVAAIKNISNAVAVNGKVDLPSTVQAYLPDGTLLDTTFAVVWNEIDPQALAQEGEVVVEGTADVLGEEMPVIATIRVTNKQVTAGENVAPFAVRVTQDIPENLQSDTLAAVNDKNLTPSANNSGGANPTIWSNYESAQAGNKEAKLTFTYDTAQNISQVNVYYHRDSWSLRDPKAVSFYWSKGAGEQEELINATASQPETVSGAKKITYTLEKPIPAVSFSLKVENSDENLGNRQTSVGITEVELITAVESFAKNSSADLEEIHIGDRVVSGSDLTNEIIVDSLDVDIATLSGNQNVAVTVLPKHDNVIRILTESEDKTNHREYILRSRENINFKEQRINLAIGATATANDSETSYWGPDKAIDGIINPEAAKPNQSRWATNVGNGPKILTVNLTDEKQVDEFLINWERNNVKGFKIESSVDGQNYSTIYEKTDDTYVSEETFVALPSAVSAKHIRLTVDRYDGGSINWPSVSLYDFQILGREPIQNLAHQKQATSQTGDGANRVTDGDLTTNWTSSEGHDQKSIQVDLGQVQDVASVVLEWMKLNATDYTIQLSQDGTNWTTAKHLTSKSQNVKDVINLNASTQARYVKLVVDAFDNVAQTGDGNTVDSPTISLAEFEVYNKKIYEVRQKSLQEIANDIQLPPIVQGEEKWRLPEVPDGVSIEFIGADFEQIIDNDLTIYQPIVDTNVSVNYRLKRGDEVYETPAMNVLVTGKYRVEAEDNAKLNIVPGLAEWKGLSGQFTPTETSRIVINPNDKDALDYLATSFKEDYTQLTGRPIEVVYSNQAQAGDFYFELNQQDKGLKEEGYLMTIGDFVKVEANHKTGAFWSTQTLLQTLKQDDTAINKGIARDYPKYRLRGFVLDVGRKPIELNVLKDMIKSLSWYKYNDFQLHLNDNYIWVEERQNTDDPYGSYSAFRLESDIKEGGNNGLNKADLTAKDLFYTKQEFKDLIDWAKQRGIRIVPEFDTPAHSLAFTKVRPDLTMKDHTVRRWVDHLEVSDPESFEFVKSVWNEYIDGGDKATFANTNVIHVGVDEFEGNNEAFRSFTDKLIKYAISKGKTPRIWGSLSMKPGTTAVQSDGVEMNIWNSGWAVPKEMYKQGYTLINTLDGQLYIVPAAGYYYDYLNSKHLYDNWEPNKMGDTVIPAGSSQMAGAAFAIWNDMVDKKANGILSYDIYKRFDSALPALAAKMWGNRDIGNYTNLKATADAVGAPVGINPYATVESLSPNIMKYTFDLGTLDDTSGNNRDGIEANHVVYEHLDKDNKALRFSGEGSYFKTPIEKVGPNNSLSVLVKLSSNAEGEQILAENDTAALKLVQKDTGKVGYSTEGYHHSFNYTLPKDEWVKLTFKGYENRQELYVNDELVDTLSKTQTGGKHATLVLPVQYIGGRTTSFTGLLDQIVVAQEETVAMNPLDSQGWTITTDNENSDGVIGNAFDGDLTTIWHTKWQPSKQDLPASILIDMKESQTIDALTYIPRVVGTNGNLTEYKLYGKVNDSDDFTLLSEGTLGGTSSTQTIAFAPTDVRYVKLDVLGGVGGFGSAAELIFGKKDDKAALRKQLLEAMAHIELIQHYTDETAQNLLDVANNSAQVFQNTQAKSKDVIQATDLLAKAIDALKLKAKHSFGDTTLVESEKPKGVVVNKQDLEAALLTATSYLKQTDKYTAESLNALNKLVKDGQNLLTDTQVTQTNVDEMSQLINEAIKNIVLKKTAVSPNELVHTLPEYHYTEESEEVPFETEIRYNDKLLKGVILTIQKGKNGRIIRYKNDKDEIFAQKVENPIKRIIEVGTKESTQVPEKESERPIVSNGQNNTSHTNAATEQNTSRKNGVNTTKEHDKEKTETEKHLPNTGTKEIGTAFIGAMSMLAGAVLNRKKRR